MKKFLLASAALAALSTTALAADLPARRAPPVYAPPVPVFTWTGVYIGGQIGYGFGNDNPYGYATATGAGLVASATRPKGVIGGAHIGYNFSTQSFPLFGGFLGSGGVIGVEGDVDGTSARSTYRLGPVITGNYREDIQGSIRGRLGYAYDRVLFYATGGVAFGGIRSNYNNFANGAFDGYSRTRVGYTVGGGVEYAFTNNWSIRGEYRYTDFGSFNDQLNNITAGGLTVHHHETDNRVQLGVSYKFDTLVPPPVVARY